MGRKCRVCVKDFILYGYFECMLIISYRGQQDLPQFLFCFLYEFSLFSLAKIRNKHLWNVKHAHLKTYTIYIRYVYSMVTGHDAFYISSQYYCKQSYYVLCVLQKHIQLWVFNRKDFPNFVFGGFHHHFAVMMNVLFYIVYAGIVYIYLVLIICTKTYHCTFKCK